MPSAYTAQHLTASGVDTQLRFHWDGIQYFVALEWSPLGFHPNCSLNGGTSLLPSAACGTCAQHAPMDSFLITSTHPAASRYCIESLYLASFGQIVIQLVASDNSQQHFSAEITGELGVSHAAGFGWEAAWP